MNHLLNASINQTSPLYQTVSEHNAYNVHFVLIYQAETMLKISKTRESNLDLAPISNFL